VLFRSAAARPRRPARQVVRQPKDRIVWTLLLESSWWEQMSADDHALLCTLAGWQGEFFRLLDREVAEHGARPWAALRERLAAEEWGAEALALVDGEDPAIEPLLEDLRASMAQLRAADQKRAAARVLNRL
jgi:DNA primase